MAVFNPNVPQINPQEYLNYSRPISDIPANTSTGKLIAGLGNTLAEGVQVGDKLMRDKIQADMYSAIDPVRDKYSNELETQRQALLHGQKISDPLAGSSPDVPNYTTGVGGVSDIPDGMTELLPANSNPAQYLPPGVTEAPQAVQSGLDKAGMVAASQRNNQGNLSMTYYDAQLNQIAKQMRNQYPMYRAYIDQNMAAITGRNPANALITSQMSDINRLVIAQGTANRQVETALISMAKEGVPLSSQYWQALRNNQITPGQALEYVNESNAQSYGYKTALQRLDFTDKNRKFINQQAEDLINKDAAELVAKDFTDRMRITGENDPRTIVDTVRRWQAGQVQIDPDTARVWAGQMRAMGDGMESTLRNKYSQGSVDKDGNRIPSLVETLGLPRVNELIKNHVEIYRTAEKSLLDKEVGAVYADVNAIKAINDRRDLNLFGGSQGSYFQMLDFLKQHGTQKDLLDYQTYAARNHLVPSSGDLVTSNKLGALTQTAVDPKTGAYTLDQAVENARTNKIADAKVYSGFIDPLDDLLRSDSSTRIKQNVAKYFFDPSQGGNTMNKFDNDSVDSMGRYVPGKQATFAKLTDMPVATTVMKLGAPYKQNYVNWVQTNARNMYGRDIRDLGSQIPNINGLTNIQISYNTDTRQFEARNTSDKPSLAERFIMDNPLAGIGPFKSVSQTIDRVNTSLRAIQNIAEAQGLNPDAATTAFLKAAGYSAGEHGEESFTARLLNGIKVAYTKLPKDNPSPFNMKLPPDTEPMPYSGSKPKRAPSVSEFVNNPTGGIMNSDADSAPQYAGTGVIKGNLSDETVTGMDVHDIPKGMSTEDYLKYLKSGVRGGNVY